MQQINLVWLKRDLRLEDHAPLAAAVDAGLPTLIYYSFEPTLLNDPHLHESHQRFIVESLADLSKQLKPYQLRLYVFWSDVIPLFEAIQRHFQINSLFSHQEIGVASTFERDKAVGVWCRKTGVRWREFPQFAVQRGRHGRKGWSKFADQFFDQPLIKTDLNRLPKLDLAADHPLMALKCQQLPSRWLKTHASYQSGGEVQAKQQLHRFLESSLQQYTFHISKPDTSRYYSSRLSAYLAYGNLSLRRVLHQLNTLPSSRHKSAFYSRMRWHCHFVQKFESDCRIEFEPLNKAYRSLLSAHQASLDPIQQQAFFEAWSTGNTGYPLVDACMRSLLQTGFVNFRMRSMLVSVACHHLQLDWKAVAIHLAKHFLDFEAGIHYPQIQMQAGLTGFNTLRIYNPIQQSLKQDAQAKFIHEFVPELAPLPTPLQHQPYLMTPLEALMFEPLPEHYAKPIVDFVETGRAARERLWSWRNSAAVKAAVPQLLKNQVVTDA